MGATIGKGLDRKWLGKSSNLGMFIHAPSKSTLSLSHVDDIKIEQQSETHVGHIDETSGSGGTNTSVRSGIRSVNASQTSRLFRRTRT